MKRLMLAIACLLSLPCGAARADDAQPFATAVTPAADERAVREAIGAQVKAAIAADDFAGLNRLEHDYLKSRARTPGGRWKLATFHDYLRYDLGEGLVAKLGCEYRKADFVRRWAAATPHSPAPFITDAALLHDRAWCWRGSGFADDVPGDAWPKFHADVAAAAQMLDQHRWAASDPEFYAIRVDIARSQSKGLDAIQALVDKGTAREPDYFPIYDNALFSFLPQWGGNLAALDQFAHYAAHRSAATEGSGFYARAYISMQECRCISIVHHPDWPAMKQAMQDIYAHYPVPWNGNLHATYACWYGDDDEVKRYIRVMHPEASDDRAVEALFKLCQY